MNRILKCTTKGMALILIAALILTTIPAVSDDVYAAVSISQSKLTLQKGSTKKLKLNNYSGSKEITWSSSNTYAVKVTKKGKVKARNTGTATITATVGKKSYTCRVTVPNKKTYVNIEDSSVTVTEGSTYQLSVDTQASVKYMSSNTSIAKVTKKGVVKALNPGTVTITAKTKKSYDTVTVTVQAGSSVTTQAAALGTVAVRRYTDSKEVEYGDITWAKEQSISFILDGVESSDVKSISWSTSDDSIVTAPENGSGKLVSNAETVSEGTAIVTASVTYKSGSVTKYSSNVYVSDPEISAESIVILGSNAGSDRQRYITFTGLSSQSVVTWTNSDSALASITEYDTKAALTGLSEGTGTVTASVDGKTFSVTYTVENPQTKSISNIMKSGNTKSIAVTGVTSAKVTYSSRKKKTASVDSNGKVTAGKAGVTYIDVTIENIKYSCRVEVAAKGIKKIIKRAQYIVDNWTYSQAYRMKKGYYDCSSLVWKGYKAYKKYHKKLGSTKYANTAAGLFDYLEGKGQIVSYGFTDVDDLSPGDLIFYGDYYQAVLYSTPGRTLNIYHVAMYAGNGMVVEKGGQTLSYNGITYIVGIGRVVE